MPETPEQFWERVHDRLAVPAVDEWESWPFDGELRVRALARPTAEPPRTGEGGVDCPLCRRGDDDAVWSDAHWVLRPRREPLGLPVVVLLEPRVHADIHELPAELQAALGPLMIRIERAIAAVEGVGRVHIGRWGEGAEHFHLWFMARPAGFPQMATSLAAIWDDVLPPVPEDVWRANLDAVRLNLAAP